MTSKTLIEAAREYPVLFDGAMGTMLFEKGLKQGEAPELWNVSCSEIVKEVHREYLQAGAQAILTNTFGGSSLKLADSGLAERAQELNRAGAEIARSADSGKHYVVGDIGPTGKILEPYGDLKKTKLSDSFKEQISALLEGGVDALALETQLDLREACIGVQTAKSLTSLPVIVSFTFNKTKRGFFTLMGNSVSDAIRSAEDAGADIVGTNCSLNSSEMKDLVREIKGVAATPIFAKANAGLPEMVNGRVKYTQSEEDYMKDMPAYLDQGVKLIGGCCGAHPAFISALHQLLLERKQ